MVPADIVLMDMLPYLSSGKVDRKALHQDYSQRTSSTNGFTPTVRLQSIQNIFREVLGVDIGAQTLLASAGLDSLSSIRIASLLRSDGYPQNDSVALLEAQTIQDVENELDQHDTRHGDSNSEEATSTASPISIETISSHPCIAECLDEVEDVFSPAPVQIGMLAETSKDPQAYCNWMEFVVRGHDIATIQSSIAKLASGGWYLRLRIYCQDGRRSGPPLHVSAPDSRQFCSRPT